MHRKTGLALIGAITMLLPVLSWSGAQADVSVPGWARKSASLTQSPASIVAASRGQLKVVITRRTASGPSVHTVVAASESAAKKLIAAAQDDGSAIGVGIAQPVSIALSKDTYRSKQWALTTLKAETAWNSASGSGVTVAVIDTGVQSNHADLSGRVLSGFDVLAPKTSANDENGHGTHVAGIIAAIANNSKGIAGLAKSAKVLPVRVLDAHGNGDTADVATGITWAANHGAKVINLSLSSDAPDPATQAAVAYAISRNIVVVAAAGNDGCKLIGNKISYPAAYPGVVGVASIDSNQAISTFSNCGSTVDLAAPGAAILSTMISKPASELHCPTTGYCTLSGTSMATPYVAAEAAMAIEEIGSTWTQAGVQALMEGLATDLGPVGRDNSSGYGLINPVALLRHINTHFVIAVPTVATTAGGTVPVSGRLLLTDGSPLVSAAITVATKVDGKTMTRALSTDTDGAFATSFVLPRNATFTATYKGSANTDDTTKNVAYSKVRPNFSFTHTSSKVTVTSRSLYGQKLALQKKSGSSWKTVTSTKVTKKTWSATARKGTWRLYSSANSALTSYTSSSWKN